MKKLFYLILIATALLIGACGGPVKVVDKNERSYSGVIITVETVDSCEYIVATEFQNSISIVHKENCKNTFHKN